MSFTPNSKTLQYIKALLTSKLGNHEKSEKLGELVDTVSILNKRKELFNKNIIFDRNIILQLQILSNLISYFQYQKTNKKPYSMESICCFKEIVSILDVIETNYFQLKLCPRNVFIIRPTELFNSILNTETVCIKIFDKYIELAKEYIDQLEIMAYAIINNLDEIDFDINSYSVEFFDIFLSIPLYSPEN